MDRITINVIVMQTINAQITTMEIYNGKKSAQQNTKSTKPLIALNPPAVDPAQAPIMPIKISS